MNSPEREWPPRNAREALLSSPNGRRRYEERRARNGASPSPLKVSATRGIGRSFDVGNSEDDDQDEDEETLQLQLQAIEAKLKLKKLQAKKSKTKTSASNSDNEDSSGRAASRAQSALSSQKRNPTLSRSKSTADVQVPLSPERRTIQPEPQRSPGRVLLGIDKGLSARHVSLKRAPSARRVQTGLAEPFRDSRDILSGSLSTSSGTGAKSFSERIAAARDSKNKEQERQVRLEKLRQNRSAGFGVRDEDLRKYESTAAEKIAPRVTQQPEDRTFSREEVLKGLSSRDGSGIRRSNSVGVKRSTRPVAELKKAATKEDLRGDMDKQAITEAAEPSQEGQQAPEAGDPALFEAFSSCNLSRRVLPHSFIKRTIDDMAPVKIPELLKEVKAPDFSLPENLEADFVLFAIVGSKSDPIAHKQSVRADTKEHTFTAGMEAEKSERNEQGNFMVITLTDLKWTLDLFLFGTAFTKYRKLTPGTLVAILNPDIMPPQRHKVDTGRFSLRLSSSDETVLEIGTSKDLGWCSANKRDGKPCGAWIDKRLTTVCEFHSSVSIDKLRSGRMEVQGMSAPFGPGGRKGSWAGGSSNRGGSGRQGSGARKASGLKPNDTGPQYNREAQSAYYFVQGQKSAANLLDADDYLHRGAPNEERSRQELARQEKERKIAEGLGMRGNGAGAEYLRQRGRSALKQPTEGDGGDAANGSASTEPRNAASLGLVAGKGKDVMLSPLKRKTSGGDEGTVKKKTRFVTARGIREAGRDSLGMESLIGMKLGQLDDDDLDIV